MHEESNAAIIRSAYEAMAQGDVPAFAGLLDDDITWHESTPGFRGDYHGRDQALALLGSVMQEIDEVKMLPVRDILAGDDHVAVLHELTATRHGRTLQGKYVDVYRLRGGRATEHWHLPLDPQAEEAFWQS